MLTKLRVWESLVTIISSYYSNKYWKGVLDCNYWYNVDVIVCNQMYN